MKNKKEHIMAFKISLLLLIFSFFLFYLFQYFNHSGILSLGTKGINKYFVILSISIFTYFISFYISKITIKPIRDNNKRLKEYNHNLAHELKTPLSVIKSDLELLELGNKLDLDIIKSSKDEIISIESIIDSLLFLSRGDTSFKKDKINLKNEIINIIDKYFPYIKSNLYLEIDNIEIYFNKELFIILIKNLIENSIKYGKKSENIKIFFNGNNLVIKNKLENKLISIDKKRLFEAFYQADNSRNTKGYGLGLSIAKKIVDLHKAKINIDIKNDFFIVSIVF